jgi:hypothetical protein
MLTVRAMVRVGPWTVVRVDHHSQPIACERCGTATWEVWVCKIDDGHDLTQLGGKAEWQIGSKCGPTLMLVNKEVWNNAAKEVTRRLRLVARVDKILVAAAAASYSLPDKVAAWRPALLDGTLDDRSIKHLGGMMAGHERKLGLRK